MTTKPWCPLPWAHLSVKNSGALRVCSHSQSNENTEALLLQDGKPLRITDLNKIDHLNCDTLKGIRKKFIAGEWPSQCRRCESDFKLGKDPRNIWEEEKHKAFFTREEALSLTAPDGKMRESRIHTLDLRLGNQCNLRCTMCFPGESSLWLKDYKAIMGEDHFVVDEKVYDLEGKNHDFAWALEEKNLDFLVEKAASLRKIKFGGGEPLLLKTCGAFVKKLAATKFAKNIELEFSANVTVIPDFYWPLWENFREVRLCCSLDGVGAINEAIRFPSKWDSILKNLEKIEASKENISAFTSSSVSLLNLEHHGAYLIWLANNKFEKINRGFSRLGASHPVYTPGYLNLGLLEPPQSERIFSQLLSQLGAIASDTVRTKAKERIEYYRAFATHGGAHDIARNRRLFAERFWRFAERQNQDWRKLFPFAASLADEWQ